ncbi:MAG TPA: phage tail sheath C-terminal domain-containing protein [Roseomonas sp.]
MVQVSYPGVYIQEKPSGVRTITGVATSVAAFFGRASKGPLDTPVRVLSLADLGRSFGAAHPKSDLSASVTQFFANGGTDCYVVRLASASAKLAEIGLRNLAGAEVLRASAKSKGAWGNGLRLEVSYGTSNPGETFTLRVAQEEGGREAASESFTNLTMDPTSPRFAPSFVSQSSQLIGLKLATGLDPNAGSFPGFSEARRPLGTNDAGVKASLDALISPGGGGTRRMSFDISIDGSAFATVNLGTLTAMPGTAAAIATELQTRINAVAAAMVPARAVTVTIAPQATAGGNHFLRITANTTGGDNATVRIRKAPASDLAGALLLGAENGGVELARRSDLRPAPTGSVLRLDLGGGNLTPLNELAGLVQNALTSVTVGGEPAIPLNAAPNNIQTTGGGDPFTRDNRPGDSASDHNDGLREKLGIIAQAITNAAGSRFRAELQGNMLVVLAKDGTVNETPSAVTFAGPGAAAINPRILRNTRQYALGTAGTSSFTTGGADGDDGGAPGFADYVGDPVLKTGFHALDTVDLFNLMVLPTDAELADSVRRQLWGPASIYCQKRRAFLLMDAPDSWTDSAGRPSIVQNTADANDLRGTVVKDHSAVFYPKLRFNDRGLVRSIGASGAIAGLVARTDATRGVWKAPAGTDADLRGVLGLDVRLTDLENGVLNKLGVNCLRSFPSGTVNWGARTLDGLDDLGSEWKYIPIRRLALFIEESLYRGTQWAVFEPNDEPLWASIRLNVGAFMNGLFRQGAFQGTTRDEAFFVKCDAETTTQADRNLGIVNIEVGFAPLKPAEFVVITIQQIAGDLQ